MLLAYPTQSRVVKRLSVLYYVEDLVIFEIHSVCTFFILHASFPVDPANKIKNHDRVHRHRWPLADVATSTAHIMAAT